MKVNRCLTEGRRALRERLEDIEAGRECERWAGLLTAVADGEASAKDLAILRPHLRTCSACRAALRDHRMAQRGIAALVPVAALGPVGGAADAAPGLLVRMYDAVFGGAHERAVTSVQKLQAGLEVASTGKVAAVAASATALAGGGMAAVQRPLAAASARDDRPALKRDREDRHRRDGDRGSQSGRQERRYERSEAPAPDPPERSANPAASRHDGSTAGRGSDPGSEFSPGGGDPSPAAASPSPAAMAAEEAGPAPASGPPGAASAGASSPTTEFGP